MQCGGGAAARSAKIRRGGVISLDAANLGDGKHHREARLPAAPPDAGGSTCDVRREREKLMMMGKDGGAAAGGGREPRMEARGGE